MNKLFLYSVITFGIFISSNALAESHKAKEPALHVRGEAQLQVAPDKVTLVVGVTSQASTAKKALKDNSLKIQKIINSLQVLGLKEKDYKTQNFNVQPVWSSRPRNSDASWRAKIVSYRVQNDLSINTNKLELVGELIAAATQAGANNIRSIRFGLQNSRQYRKQAITQAVKNARADADVAAVASGVDIIGVQTLHLDHAPSVTQMKNVRVARAEMLADASSVPPIQSGDIRVRASVSIVYKIK